MTRFQICAPTKVSTGRTCSTAPCASYSATKTYYSKRVKQPSSTPEPRTGLDPPAQDPSNTSALSEGKANAPTCEQPTVNTSTDPRRAGEPEGSSALSFLSAIRSRSQSLAFRGRPGEVHSAAANDRPGTAGCSRLRNGIYQPFGVERRRRYWSIDC